MSVYAAAEKIAAVIQEHPEVDHAQALAIALLVRGLVRVQPVPKPAAPAAAPAAAAPPVEKKPEVPNTVVATSPM